MEEEMRKIEEEFAFQEKWIKIFKRGKFFFQNIPEHLILKVITKLEAKDFLKILMTGKWMHLFCRENRDSLLIPFDISDYDKRYLEKSLEVVKKERNHDIQQLRKIIRSKYYFSLPNYECYGDLMVSNQRPLFPKRRKTVCKCFGAYCMKWTRPQDHCNLSSTKVALKPFLEDLYLKEAYHFRRECWNVGLLRIHKSPINISIINHLQPIICEIDMNQNGPFSKNFNIPARTKSFFVNYSRISDFDFYKEIERFGSLPLKLTFRRNGHLELDKLFSTLKRITQKRHLHHPLQFLTHRRESRTNYEIFNSWPMDSLFPSNEFNFFHLIIVAKSDVGVSVIHLYRCHYISGSEEHTLQIMGIKSFNEWEEFIKSEIVHRYFNLETGYTISKEQLAKVLEVFSTQVAGKFFERGKLVYPPLAPPEPALEFVEFLKEFEDFDIQPDKLAPHKPKWKKTEKLPELPRKLPEIHSNNWLIEAREVIKLRKFWMDFLQKGKFILELIPLKNVLDIAKRIEYKSFPLLFSSTKWVNELIRNSASNFRIHGESSRFSMNRIYNECSRFKEALKSLEFYYLNEIFFGDFEGFSDDINKLKEVLQWVRERKIFVKQISLGNKCPLIQELFESFTRGPESLLVDQYATFSVPVKFPAQLKEIVVDVYFFNYQSEELMETFTGIEQAVIWLCHTNENTNTTITHQLKTLKSKMCRSNILITNRDIFHLRIYYYSHLDLSRISETVFIFRSMARGRGGAWNYFIRLEKAGSGAVGIAHFADSLNVIIGIQRSYCEIRCEYFPTMESFLDYFEREVGSKRRARDWMQLREKDKTIEPREEDFKELKKLKPFIHFNEQKEANDFKEVRRRFFS